MGSLFLLAFREEEFLAALAMAGSEAFFNKLLMPDKRSRNRTNGTEPKADVR
jgi:hypothetical protein